MMYLADETDEFFRQDIKNLLQLWNQVHKTLFLHLVAFTLTFLSNQMALQAHQLHWCEHGGNCFSLIPSHTVIWLKDGDLKLSLLTKKWGQSLKMLQQNYLLQLDASKRLQDDSSWTSHMSKSLTVILKKVSSWSSLLDEWGSTNIRTQPWLSNMVGDSAVPQCSRHSSRTSAWLKIIFLLIWIKESVVSFSFFTHIHIPSVKAVIYSLQGSDDVDTSCSSILFI